MLISEAHTLHPSSSMHTQVDQMKTQNPRQPIFNLKCYVNFLSFCFLLLSYKLTDDFLILGCRKTNCHTFRICTLWELHANLTYAL